MSQPREKRREPERAALGEKVIGGALLGLALLLAIRFLLADDGYKAIRSRSHQLAGIREDIQLLKQSNAALGTKILALREDPYSIEKIAREELDFAAPGEVVYLFPGELSRENRRPGSAEETGAP